MAKYTKSKHYKNNHKQRIVYIIVISSLLFTVGLYSFFKFNLMSKIRRSATVNDISNINYGPPTEEEQRAGNDIKVDITQSEQNNQKPSTDQPNEQNAKRSDLPVIISDATQYSQNIEVSAFIPNYFEDGKCIMTFSLGNLSVVKETDAHADASTTICANIAVPRSEFGQPGMWSLVVRYVTNNVDSSSNAKEVVVQ